ncbi:hypothetical protein CLOSTHATH_05775 [Hungatella hathewayi DSM 13479]|uniref:Uncharacterized protein n=1 Tax=Hungatella hathewayi DSM 13479 TaxID=566550 RepID=D3AQ69_9FIRM|nr:hypothetical protein CLOSTHATH_05775 [Hungatella hathewayi DSM 13479]
MVLDRLRKRKINRYARIWLIELEYQRTETIARISFINHKAKS